MKFFDKIKEKLFPANTNPKQPVVHEELKRRQAEQERYRNWRQSPKVQEITSYLCEQYQLHLQGGGDQSMMRILSTNPSTKGFLLRYPAQLRPEEFQHIFDFLRDLFLQQGYKLYASDRKVYNRKTHAETIERHYLKPRIRHAHMKPPVDQLFGNIIIELFKNNDQPTHLRFLCHSYHDAKYAPAKGLDEMMGVICIPNEE